MSSSGPVDCRYRLDTTSSATLVLPKGRKLGYAEYGALTGQPILYLHSFPRSRVEAASLDHLASKLGARIIVIDRPGFGWSSPQRNRTFLSHAQDVEALANHLRLQRYGVRGISGGGPYALACVQSLLAGRLRTVAIVCGLGSPDMGYSGMNWMSWMGWTFGARMFLGLCRWWFGRMPAVRIDLSDEERMRRRRKDIEKDKAKMSPKDHAIFEAFGQGMDGFSDDFRLLNPDFGFRIEDLRKDLPVQLWHGWSDMYIPLHHGEKVAARLGNNAHLRVSDDTNANIWADRKEEYLGELVRAMTAGPIFEVNPSHLMATAVEADGQVFVDSSELADI